MPESEQQRCPCHDVPMYWHKDANYAGGGRWRCREARKPHDAKRWESYYHERIPFPVRVHKDMSARRSQALNRRRERQLRREHGSL